MSGGYSPKVSNPNTIFPQMTSEVYQKPFYFGSSQVPINLGLSKNQYSGAGFSGAGFTGDRPPKYTDGKYHILKGSGIRLPLKK